MSCFDDNISTFQQRRELITGWTRETPVWDTEEVCERTMLTTVVMFLYVEKISSFRLPKSTRSAELSFVNIKLSDPGSMIYWWELG